MEIKIGIIGGTGFYDSDIVKEAVEMEVDTPFGRPSDCLTQGKINGVECVIIPRHGRNHDIMPGNVNYRANLFALKKAGCTHVLATAAVGSLQDHVHPGDLLVLSEFYDMTRRRESTFYDGKQDVFKGVVHIPGSDPFCEMTRNVLIEACERKMEGRKYNERSPKHPCYHQHGCIVVIEGPRFSSRTESKSFHAQGFDVIGMTTMPEVILAKELGLCYAVIAIVTDFDSWKDGENEVHHAGVVEIFKKNLPMLKSIIYEAVTEIKRTSNVWPEVIKGHRYLPLKHTKLLTFLRNGTLILWDLDTFDCVFKVDCNEKSTSSYKTISVTEDGNFLFAGGASPMIHVWSLLRYTPTQVEQMAENSKEVYGPHLMEVIKLTEKMKSAKKVIWLPKFGKLSQDHSPINEGALCVLSCDGRVYILTRVDRIPSEKLDIKMELKEVTSCCSKSDDNFGSDRVFWNCIRVITSGQDLIYNMFASHVVASVADFSDPPYLLFLLDWNGSLIVENLKACKQPPAKKAAKQQSLVKCVLNTNTMECRVQKTPKKDKYPSVKPRYLQINTSPPKPKQPKQALKMEELADITDTKKLRMLLKQYHRFPDKYR
ncbi:hypothetical protein Ciccas_002183 [Cichlidogyrus casuarinus]|uniref:Purine nucleoside phosphorylase n=1 Tax=Cichlidogyrus casuarinus TaxID=1844966 RepID=A0ABD2QL41_9PLAT